VRTEGGIWIPERVSRCWIPSDPQYLIDVVATAGTWQVELASDGGGEAAPYTGSLAPHQAVILRP
jgi:hypothetical protein